MTSSRLFFRVLREDMRHKIWMMALSALGNFIAQPVTWLLLATYYDGSVGTLRREEFFVKAFYGVMKPAALSIFASCSFVCIATAFVTGVFGFRYVFRADMVDTYHSLPVKRRTLYGACYLNGILIWLIPFIACLAPTFGMMCGYASWLERMLGTLAPGVGTGVYQYSYMEEPLWTVLAKETVLNVGVLALAFLLVYHVALTAVMISGNILNTLVSMIIMGFGAVGIYGLGDSFFSFYLKTFFPNSRDWTKVIYASPLCSAVRLLYERLKEGGVESVRFLVPVNVGVAVLLGACAYMLYRRRASEAAEQGITNKTVAAALRLVASVCAGMLGWLLLAAVFAESQRALWGSFGAVLAAGLTAGILDIIFQMDFGAFFSHKIQMAAGIVLSLLICGAFYGDWFGYDTYLPEKKEIAQIAVFDWNLSSKAFYQNEAFLFENMSFQDVDVIYACLERMTAGGESAVAGDYLETKITLKNGSSYYRRYKVTEADKELLWPILSSEQYLEYAYLIDEELVDEDTVSINVMGRQSYPRTAEELEQFRRILRAYNRDVLEHTENVLQGGGRILAVINFDVRLVKEGTDVASRGYANLVICEGMEYSVEALREEGFGEQMADRDPAEVMAIVLEPGSAVDGDMTPEERIAMARIYYGIPEEEQETAENEAAGYASTSYPVSVLVSDPEEVRELLGLLSFTRPSRMSRLFQKYYKTVTVVDSKGNSESWYIPEGVLPEKYILRFGEL